jgi:hypothetical protein
MLYKFKSKVTGDLIMLEANGRQMLTIVGKGDPTNLAQGILTPENMPAATAALVQAVQHDDEARASTEALASQGDDTVEPLTTVSLRQRAAPFLEMIQRCQADNTPIVWGV